MEKKGKLTTKMELPRVTITQYKKLKKLGFPINTTSKHPTPTVSFVLQWLRSPNGKDMTIYTIPDIAYQDIVGWWTNIYYGPRTKRFPTYNDAEIAGINLALDFLTK